MAYDYIMTDKHVINTVREIRSAQSFTQQELADSVEVSRQTIVAIEKGNYTPSVLLALKIAKVLGVQVEDIFSTKLH